MLNDYLTATFGPKENKRPTLLENLLSALILLSVFQVVLETEPYLINRYQNIFQTFEKLFLLVFLFEYALRVVYAGTDSRYQGLIGRCRFIVTPYALVDLVAILPSLVFLIGQEFLLLRVFRLVRLFRIARLVRDNLVLRAFFISFKKASGPLLATLCVTIFLLFCGAVLMFLVEGQVQPDQFGSIPRALWWAMATLTTVGYGDVYPITPIGKLLASCIALIGIGIVAMPAGVIAANFSKELDSLVDSPASSDKLGND